MTSVVKLANGSRIVVFAVEKDDECELCHKTAELRPYGANSERICIECAKKNPEVTKKRMAQHLFGERLDS
jgi:hypothetical protein